MPIKKRYALNQSPLYKLGSRPKLARLLGLSNGELRRLSGADSLYTEFDIPKSPIQKFIKRSSILRYGG